MASTVKNDREDSGPLVHRASAVGPLWLSGLSLTCFLLALVLRLLDPPEIMSVSTSPTGSRFLDEFVAEPTDEEPSAWPFAVIAGLALLASGGYWMRSRRGGGVYLRLAATVTVALLVVTVITVFTTGGLLTFVGTVLACAALLLSAVTSNLERGRASDAPPVPSAHEPS